MRGQSHLFIGIGSRSKAVRLRADQNQRSKITHINEETGHTSINGMVSQKKTHHLLTRHIPQKWEKSFPKRQLRRRGITSLDLASHFAKVNASQFVVILNG